MVLITEGLDAQQILMKLNYSLLNPFVVKELAPGKCIVCSGRTDQQAVDKIDLPARMVSDHFGFVWSEKYNCGVSQNCSFIENTHKPARDVVVEWILTKIPVLARKLSLGLTDKEDGPGTEAIFEATWGWQGKKSMYEELSGLPGYWNALVEQHHMALRRDAPIAKPMIISSTP